MDEIEKADISEISNPVEQGYYSIVSSYTIRPQSEYGIAVSVHNADCPCEFQLILKGPSYDARKSVTVQPMSTEYVKFYTPAIKEGDYQLIAKGLDGIIFIKSTALKFQNNYPIVFIQKDKATYKPGDTVQFRVLFMDDRTRPMSFENSINITISDSQKDRVKQWKNVQLNIGVYRGEFQLSEHAILGDWQIDVTIEGETLKTAFFEVDKYVLPKFSASIETVKDVAIYDGIVNVTVRSQYTFGKGVNGKAIVSIKPRPTYIQQNDADDDNSDDDKNKTNVAQKTIDMESGKGEVEFRIGKDFNVESGVDNYMVISAIVEENFTGNKMEASTNLTLHSQRFRFEGIDNPYEFHPGKCLVLRIAVKTIDDKPVRDCKNPLKLIIEKKRFFLGDDNNERYYDENNVLAELEEYFDPCGIVTFQYRFPKGEQNYYYLKCRYLECESHFLTLSKYRPPDPKDIGGEPDALKVSVRTKHPKLKENVEVKVQASDKVSYFVYTIHGRGRHLKTEMVSLPKTTENYIIDIAPTFEMMPYASIFVHSVVGNDLKYADTTVSFDWDFENFIDIIAPNETHAGKEIQIKLHTNPESLVGLLAVDQSVRLLKSGNDLDMNQIFDSLQRFDNAFAWRNREARCPGENSGLVTITNANYPIYDVMESIMFCEDDGMLRPHDAAKGSSPQMPRIRKEFPETWLFEDIESLNSNCYVLHKIVPDTITSWVITGFSMNPEYGLALTKNPSIVRAFRSFFISTDLPYSVQRGEEITFPVILFNYMDFDLKASVTLDNRDDEYDLLDLGSMQTECTKGVTIHGDSTASVTFTIRPKRVGFITLKLTAASAFAGDRLFKQMKVEPEGIREYRNKDFFLQSKGASIDMQNHVKLDIPDNYVPDSLFIEVSVMGNILSSTITNIDNLVRLPCGCGEQIMVNFVPNILTLRYLDSIRELKKPIEEKAKRHLEIGYQSELSYKHDDGSYSAFGKSDPKGSTWLTAYVVRCFCQAKKYIEIDNKILLDGLNFLAKVQLHNGSFPELGHVLDSSRMNEVALTAFVLLAFMENVELMGNYERTIDRGFNYIQNNIRNINDLFPLAVGVYALQRRKHEAAQEIMERLESLAHGHGPFKYWSKEEKPKKNAVYSWNVPNHDVEITGYILMTLLDMNVQVFPIVRWLISRRNHNGGFGSTQDTVVGLWALVKFAEMNSAGLKVDMSIEIVMPENVHPVKKFNVNKDNALMTQSFELPKKTRELFFCARGSGTAVLQISYSYNLKEKELKPSFKLNIYIKPVPSILSMDVLVEYITENKKKHPKSNMAVMEVTLPSGYTAITQAFDKIKEIENVKRVESKNKDTVIVVYFDNLRAADEKCIPIEAERSFEVDAQKPVPIKIYDYYDNEKGAILFY